MTTLDRKESDARFYTLKTGEIINLYDRKGRPSKDCELAWDLTPGHPKQRLVLYRDHRLDKRVWRSKGRITVLDTKVCGICFAMQQSPGHWSLLENVPSGTVRRIVNGQLSLSEYQEVMAAEQLHIIEMAKFYEGEDYWERTEGSQ